MKFFQQSVPESSDSGEESEVFPIQEIDTEKLSTATKVWAKAAFCIFVYNHYQNFECIMNEVKLQSLCILSTRNLLYNATSNSNFKSVSPSSVFDKNLFQ